MAEVALGECRVCGCDCRSLHLRDFAALVLAVWAFVSLTTAESCSFVASYSV